MGAGKFGSVTKAVNIENPQDVLAIKVFHETPKMKNPNGFSPTAEAKICGTVGCLASKYIKHEGHKMIPMKYQGEQIGNVDSSGMIHGVKDRFKGVVTFQSLSDAISRVHKKGVIHGDAHFGNVVFNKATGKLEMIDFGLAQKFNPKTGFDSLGRSIYSDEAFLMEGGGGILLNSKESKMRFDSLLKTHFEEAQRYGIDPLKGLTRKLTPFEIRLYSPRSNNMLKHQHKEGRILSAIVAGSLISSILAFSIAATAIERRQVQAQ